MKTKTKGSVSSAGIEMVDRLSAKGATSSKPGASPQGHERIDASAESALQPTDLPIDPSQALPE
jgi:hypothetical protein